MKKPLLAFALTYFTFSSVTFGKELFLDVRTPAEFAQDHVPDAIHVNVQNTNFKNDVSKLDKNDRYLVYCRTGRRSAETISIMKEMGFKHLENLGGLEEAKKVYEERMKTKN